MIENASACEIADCIQRLRPVPMMILIRHVEYLVNAVHRPARFVFETERCEQDNCASLRLAFPDERFAFFIAGDTQDRHSAMNPAAAPTQSRPLLKSTPICAPRPIRTIVFTGRSSSSHKYIMRISTFAGPYGVSITGRKSTRR